jgi:hypothetical protein
MATKIVERELWKNVSPGLRYYIVLDAIGNQTFGLAQPGRTFTITPLERQLSQQAAHDSKADLFRNGTFVLIKDTEDTVVEEITSPDSVTDGEIETAVAEALAGDTVPIEAMIERTSSVVTGQRILEELVLQDAAQSLVNAAKAKIESVTDRPVGPDGEPMKVVERESVPSPDAEPADMFRKERALRPR